MAINVCENIACWREFSADRWEPYCSPECRQQQTARLTVPYSLPHTVCRNQPAPPARLSDRQVQARDAVRADRASGSRRTMSVHEAETALSRERTADATRRLNDMEEDDIRLGQLRRPW
jgi:hypothetical protein